MLLASLLCQARAEVARAFSDPEEFARTAGAGGGGGRYFTASYLDGYGCNVCHRGGIEPQVSVIGLPIDGYVPGQTYDVEVSWKIADPKLDYALQLELLGRNGGVPGTVALLDPAQVGAPGRCGALPAGKVPAYERVVGQRKILGVTACLVQSLRFRFTPANVDDLAFTASVISSNKTASVEGDGVTNLRRVLHRVGTQPKSSGCALAPRAAGAPLWPLALLLAGFALRRRASRGRR